MGISSFHFSIGIKEKTTAQTFGIKLLLPGYIYQGENHCTDCWNLVIITLVYYSKRKPQHRQLELSYYYPGILLNEKTTAQTVGIKLLLPGYVFLKEKTTAQTVGIKLLLPGYITQRKNHSIGSWN